MKTSLFVIVLLAQSLLTFSQEPNAQPNEPYWIRDEGYFQRGIENIYEICSPRVKLLRDVVKQEIPNADTNDRSILEQAVKSFDELIERKDTTNSYKIFPLTQMMAKENPKPYMVRINDSLESMDEIALPELNQCFYQIMDSRMCYYADKLPEEEIDVFIRFTCNNPAQTTEEVGMWPEPGILLYIIGEPLLGKLAELDRKYAKSFYEYDLEARISQEKYKEKHGKKSSYLGQEGETPAQQQRYDSNFSRLEALVKTGKLPPPDPNVPREYPLKYPKAMPASPEPASEQPDEKPIVESSASAPSQETPAAPLNATHSPANKYVWALIAIGISFLVTCVLIWVKKK